MHSYTECDIVGGSYRLRVVYWHIDITAVESRRELDGRDVDSRIEEWKGRVDILLAVDPLDLRLTGRHDAAGKYQGEYCEAVHNGDSRLVGGPVVRT